MGQCLQKSKQTNRQTKNNPEQTALDVVGSISLLKWHLNELEKPGWEGAAALCVPGTWHSCQGFLLPAVPATSALWCCSALQHGSPYFLFSWHMKSNEETWVINFAEFSSVDRGATGSVVMRGDKLLSLLKRGCALYLKIGRSHPTKDT